MPSHYLGGHFFGFNFFKTLPLNKFNSESNFRACVERDEGLGFIQLGKVSLQIIKAP